MWSVRGADRPLAELVIRPGLVDKLLPSKNDIERHLLSRGRAQRILFHSASVEPEVAHEAHHRSCRYWRKPKGCPTGIVDHVVAHGAGSLSDKLDCKFTITRARIQSFSENSNESRARFTIDACLSKALASGGYEFSNSVGDAAFGRSRPGRRLFRLHSDEGSNLGKSA